MAQRTIIMLTDDIDGSTASETVAFSLDGASYEIDLNDDHASDLREVMSVYVGSARRTGGSAARRPRPASAPAPRAAGEVDTKAVRAWARANGIEVNSRGQLKADVIDRYNAVN